VETLRRQAWSDRAVLDLTLVVSYFGFVNRIAHGLGVELEEGFAQSGATTAGR
jgi:alkylhydroperoxidase family enzyme